jgi:hypothetical protein
MVPGKFLLVLGKFLSLAKYEFGKQENVLFYFDSYYIIRHLYICAYFLIENKDKS